MNMQEIKSIAKYHNIKTAKLRKADLIHKIQQAEGNFQCYASAASGDCDQLDCIWRTDCFRDATKRIVA